MTRDNQPRVSWEATVSSLLASPPVGSHRSLHICIASETQCQFGETSELSRTELIDESRLQALNQTLASGRAAEIRSL